MKQSFLTFSLIFFCISIGPALSPLSCACAQEQGQEPDIIQFAEDEADKLQRLLDLDDWQTFYVDSTLKHDYAAMRDELDRLSKSKVSNVSLYISIQDKWMDAIDASYKKFFNEQQWAAYLKSGAAKQQKQRAKRRAKMEEKPKK